MAENNSPSEVSDDEQLRPENTDRTRNRTTRDNRSRRENRTLQQNRATTGRTKSNIVLTEKDGKDM